VSEIVAVWPSENKPICILHCNTCARVFRASFWIRAFPSAIGKSLFVFFVHRVSIKLLHLRVRTHLDSTFSLCFLFFSLVKWTSASTFLWTICKLLLWNFCERLILTAFSRLDLFQSKVLNCERSDSLALHYWSMWFSFRWRQWTRISAPWPAPRRALWYLNPQFGTKPMRYVNERCCFWRDLNLCLFDYGNGSVF
jgi:hypothetical protein